MEHGKRAAELFTAGYNCCQSVMLAFCGETKMDESLAAKIASPFGGGIGRMREICGAVSGMYMVLGILYGYDEKSDDEAKRRLYTDVQALAEKFKEITGSITCREILKNPPSDPNPTPRTEKYYEMRPCVKMVSLASDLLDEFIAEHPREK